MPLRALNEQRQSAGSLGAVSGENRDMFPAQDNRSALD
jgi:hypothetical protein